MLSSKFIAATISSHRQSFPERKSRQFSRLTESDRNQRKPHSSPKRRSTCRTGRCCRQTELRKKERWTGQASFKLLVKTCPLVLIHQADDAVQDEVSLPEHTVIRCICLYTAQALKIGQLVRQEEINNILVTTADATQGHESALSVVVTIVSRSAVDTQRKNPSGRWDRVDVALEPTNHKIVLLDKAESVKVKLEETPLKTFDEIFGEGWWDNDKAEEWHKLTLFHHQIDRQNTQLGQLEPNSTDQNPHLTGLLAWHFQIFGGFAFVPSAFSEYFIQCFEFQFYGFGFVH
uniref:Uncharacterized protein n=1 Tax=Globodera rostochiensis TaxID=31243 RepID=A0A914HQA1_GLORO